MNKIIYLCETSEEVSTISNYYMSLGYTFNGHSQSFKANLLPLCTFDILEYLNIEDFKNKNFLFYVHQNFDTGYNIYTKDDKTQYEKLISGIYESEVIRNGNDLLREIKLERILKLIK